MTDYISRGDITKFFPLQKVREVLTRTKRASAGERVEQEFWGLLMAHFAIRGLMHAAALKADEDPGRLSFPHSVRVVRRRLARYAAIPPSAEANPA